MWSARHRSAKRFAKMKHSFIARTKLDKKGFPGNLRLRLRYVNSILPLERILRFRVRVWEGGLYDAAPDVRDGTSVVGLVLFHGQILSGNLAELGGLPCFF